VATTVFVGTGEETPRMPLNTDTQSAK